MKTPVFGLKPWLDAAVSLVYPEVCQICRNEHATPAEGFVCATCWQKVRFIKPPFCERCGLPYEGAITTIFECENCRGVELHFRSARSAVIAGEFIRDIIARYKYNREMWFEPFLADLLLRQAVPELARERCDMIVPVPLHPTKLREREFNQAERLAEHLGRAVGVPLNTKLLKRVEFTRTQTQLTRAERSENVRKAFAATPGAKLDGVRVVVLDDVFTTGATTGACARILMAMGAEDVRVWSVARGL